MASTKKSNKLFLLWGVVASVLFLATALYVGLTSDPEINPTSGTDVLHGMYLFFLGLLPLLAFLFVYLLGLVRDMSAEEGRVLGQIQLVSIAILLPCVFVQVKDLSPSWLEYLMGVVVGILISVVSIALLFGAGMLFFKRHRYAGFQLLVVGALTMWWFESLGI